MMSNYGEVDVGIVGLLESFAEGIGARVKLLQIEILF